jgi:hypothetical protein
MVTSQYENIPDITGSNFVQMFAHGISRTLVPIGYRVCLLRGQDLHPTSVKNVKVIGLCNMAIQRN